MTLNEFIGAINALGTVKSSKGKTYSHIKANENVVSGLREEACSTFRIKTQELYKAYCEVPNATTTVLKDYISGRMQSPAMAILSALTTGHSSSVFSEKKPLLHISEPSTKKSHARADCDEYYVIRLCNKVLGQIALQQHHFSFLKGDNGTTLPVDAYYPDLNLVVEYREYQHTGSVPFFDKKMTVSGVNRGDQRKIYDQRRRDELPRHGIDLVEISYSDFGTTKKLLRDEDHDTQVVKKFLAKYIK